MVSKDRRREGDGKAERRGRGRRLEINDEIEKDDVVEKG